MWAAQPPPMPQGCCCGGSVSLWVSALQGQDCHTGLSVDTQGFSPPCVTPVPDPSWPPAALKLPGLGHILGASQARFLSETKTGKLTLVLHTLQRKSCSWAAGANSPTSLLHGEALGLSGGITSAFFPETTGLEHHNYGMCLKEPSMPVPSGQDTRVCRLEAGTTVRAKPKCRVPSECRQGPGCVTHLPHY